LTLRNDDDLDIFYFNETKYIEIINAIWKFRNETKIPVCFTLDAGANVHVLYPKTLAEKFCNLLSELVGYCQNGHL
jgi:diphosphomevalonate decarboxylase